MRIREIRPAGDLAEYVEAYWWSDGPASSEEIRVLPDGCTDIVFDETSAMVVGTMTRPLQTTASSALFGIRFRAGRGALALRAPLSVATDAQVPLRDLTRRFPPVDPQRLETVEAALRRVFADASPDRRVDGAVQAIVRSGGRVPIEALCARIGISRQHLARTFAHHVGVSPKTFARIIRFRRALALARAGEERWGELAMELGYFDQSHLIAEFREFAGKTPVPFFLSPPE